MSQLPLAIDLFCGAGGLSLGFVQSGFKVLAAIDSDPVNVATYSKNFHRTNAIQADIFHLTGGKIRELCGIDDERIDVVFGGPPCQGFSLIGKRKPLDPRNALIGEFCRLVIELRPRYFVMENVAGLMCSTSRPVLDVALNELRSAGYDWVPPVRALDAREFGVPQRRKRVFVLGFMSGEQPPRYPEPNGSAKPTVWDAISDLVRIGSSKKLLTTHAFVGQLGTPSSYAAQLRSRKPSPQITACLLCRHSEEVVQRFRRTRQGETEPISRFTRLKKTEVAPTLRAGTPRAYGSFTAARPIHPTQPRCITVREAARLHSFPDWFTFHPTQWHGFQQVGNSVPPMLAKAVAQRIRAAIQTKNGGAK
jgi:DNA (cytosine-5)-methyltransferase 1